MVEDITIYDGPTLLDEVDSLDGFFDVFKKAGPVIGAVVGTAVAGPGAGTAAGAKIGSSVGTGGKLLDSANKAQGEGPLSKLLRKVDRIEKQSRPNTMQQPVERKEITFNTSGQLNQTHLNILRNNSFGQVLTPTLVDDLSKEEKIRLVRATNPQEQQRIAKQLGVNLNAEALKDFFSDPIVIAVTLATTGAVIFTVRKARKKDKK